jgi:uncharacterized protein YdiU (UPF0061 family)
MPKNNFHSLMSEKDAELIRDLNDTLAEGAYDWTNFFRNLQKLSFPDKMVNAKFLENDKEVFNTLYNL